jgi:hypothetical protein
MAIVRTADAGAVGGATAPPSPESRSTPPATGRYRAVLLVGAVTVVLVGFQLALTHQIGGPSMYPDEAGYLGHARWLAGDAQVWQMGPWPYYGFGYSLVLAPLFWLVGDPDTLWRSILVTNALLMASAFPLLYLFARRVLGAPPDAAGWAAVTGALVPAIVAHSSFGWAENLTLPLSVGAVVAAWAMLTPRARWQRVLFGPAVALLFAAHGRFTLLVPVGLVLVVTAAASGLLPRGLAAVNAGLLVLLAGLTLAVKDALVDARYVQVSAPEGSPSDLLGLLVDPGRWSSLLAEAAGQAWYLAAGSLLLAGLGLWALAGRVGRPGGLLTDPRRLTIALLLAGVATVFVTSTLFFTKNQWRSDHLIYGRHNDSFVPMLVTAGVLLLLQERRRARLAALVGATAGATALMAVVVLVIRDRGRFAGPYGTSSIPAVARLIGDEPEELLFHASVAAVVAGAVIGLVVLLIRRPVLVVPLAVAWFVAAGLSVVDGVDRYENQFSVGWQLPDQVEALGVERAALDLTPNNELALLTYQYWLPDVTFEPYRSARGERPGEALAFAGLGSAEIRAAGARAVLVDTRTDFALWALPGPEQEALDRQGRLLPRGFPTQLPAPARTAELDLIGRSADESLRLRPGESVRLTVRGRHAGSGSPWPNFASYGLPGLVRVGARVSATDDGSVRPQEFRAELPTWVEPGDRFATDLEVVAVDADNRPLPPGRYAVGIDMVQEGFEWFAEPGREQIRLRLDVGG